MIKDIVNHEYQELARRYDWEELLQKLDSNIQLVAGVAFLALPADAVADVDQISNKDKQFTYINKSSVQNQLDDIARATSQGTPIIWTNRGILPIKQPLSANDTVTLSNVNAADDTNVCHVSGLSSTDLVVDEAIATATGGTNSIHTYRAGFSIRSFSCDVEPTNTAGNFYQLVETTTPANVLAQIPPNRNKSGYVIIEFNQRPTGADNVVVQYKAKISRLIADDDAPIMDVGDILVEMAIAKMREYDKDYRQAQVHKNNALVKTQSLLAERDLQRNKVRQMRPDFRLRGLNRGFRGRGGSGNVW